MHALFDLFFVGRHFGAGAAVDHPHFVGAQTQRRAGGIYGRVASTDDTDAAFHFHFFAQADGPQERHTLSDAFRVLAGDADFLRRVGANGHDDGLVTFAE